MIGLDTSVLVRYATLDDPLQSAVAERIVGALTPTEPGFVSQVALVETVWVLRSLFDADDASIATFVARLLDARELTIENSDGVRRALVGTGGGPEFTDAVLAQAGLSAGCAHTVTFDRRAAQLEGMTLAM